MPGKILKKYNLDLTRFFCTEPPLYMYNNGRFVAEFQSNKCIFHGAYVFAYDDTEHKKKGRKPMKKLSALTQGENATVQSVMTEGAMRRRFQELGLVPGTEVLCLQKSFFGSLRSYLIKDAVIAIRDEDADGVIIY